MLSLRSASQPLLLVSPRFTGLGFLVRSRRTDLVVPMKDGPETSHASDPSLRPCPDSAVSMCAVGRDALIGVGFGSMLLRCVCRSAFSKDYTTRTRKSVLVGGITRASNHCDERSRENFFVEPGRESMIRIKQLRLSSARPRAAHARR